MQYKVLLSTNENIKAVEQEEQIRFTRSILEALGIPLDFWKADEPLSVDLKIELKRTLNKFDILILEGDSTKIYHEKNLIAEWQKPSYKLILDKSQKDPKKRKYMEMTVNFKSIFD